MADIASLSPAKTVLYSVQSCVDSNISLLRSLVIVHPKTLHLTLLLRLILTFLPESTEPASYLPLVKDVVKGNFPKDDVLASTSVHAENDELSALTEDAAQMRLRKLRLLHLVDPDASAGFPVPCDPLTAFVLHRARRIDANTGLLPLILQLAEPFMDESEYLRKWIVSNILPIVRFYYEYYPDADTFMGLSSFEKLRGSAGVSFLLSNSFVGEHGQAGNNVARDLKCLVGPWMYGKTTAKRRKLSGVQVSEKSTTRASAGIKANELSLAAQENNWAKVNSWLFENGSTKLHEITETFERWGGPEDVDLGGYVDQVDISTDDRQSLRNQYSQAALATLYSTDQPSAQTYELCKRIIQRVAEFTNYDVATSRQEDHLSTNFSGDDLQDIDISGDFVARCKELHLVTDNLLVPENPLTSISEFSIAFAAGILKSAHLLADVGSLLSFRDLATTCLFGSVDDQVHLLQKLLSDQLTKIKLREDCDGFRNNLHWLRTWSVKLPSSHEERLGMFGRVSAEAVESALLETLVQNNGYDTAARLYLPKDMSNSIISREKVEQIIIKVLLDSYDSASNGNRTRGGVRKASDILAAFQKYYPESHSFHQIDALLAATNALSFYSLTLQHGVPFRPVTIRVHGDPVALIGKVMEQNSRSYTQLEDLVDIGRNFVIAGLPMSESGIGNHLLPEHLRRKVYSTERRVIGMAIEAALAENDFETAYSYCLNRLGDVRQKNEDAPEDDILWRAAYHAGRYKSAMPPPASTASTSNIRQVEQRMELLSKALIIAPPSVLSEILDVWSLCEEELIVLRAQEIAEEEKWNTDVESRMLPGGFDFNQQIPNIERRREPARGSSLEDAPMGLFDVARGAAAALRKSAFPLSSGSRNGKPGPESSRDRAVSAASVASSEEKENDTLAKEARTRKRDVVSNMVTGGLATGIGWVLGAQPVRK